MKVILDILLLRVICPFHVKQAICVGIRIITRCAPTQERKALGIAAASAGISQGAPGKNFNLILTRNTLESKNCLSFNF